MDFFYSAEVYAPASYRLDCASNAVETYISEKIKGNFLADLDVTLSYIPIVMSSDLVDWYPARSRADYKRKTYNCCPQLSYEIFIGEDWAAQITEYCAGMLPALLKLAKFGATKDQIAFLETLIREAPPEILKLNPDPDQVKLKSGETVKAATERNDFMPKIDFALLDKLLSPKC